MCGYLRFKKPESFGFEVVFLVAVCLNGEAGNFS